MVDIRIQKSQSALIQAGLSILNKNHCASLSEIAQEAKVARATLYRLFETKESLIEVISLYSQQVFEDSMAEVFTKPEDSFYAFKQVISTMLRYCDELKFLLNLDKFVEFNEELRLIKDSVNTSIEHLINQGKQSGAINVTLPTSWVRNLFESILLAGVFQIESNTMGEFQASELTFTAFKNAVSS